MNAVVEFKEAQLPAPVARRGITEAQWRTAMNSLFPGAKGESVLMVFDYCAARKLDPLKKPCHIVPMKVKDRNGDYVWMDVVMPGIYEYRTTAARTGQYLGHSVPEYGPIVEQAGVLAPEWCSLTVKRWNSEAKQVAEFPVQLLFSEVVATKDGKANQRWAKAPRQMLTKCVEAAALREAFPDELGGTHTAEEMEGQNQTDVVDITPTHRVDPRGDLSSVDWEVRDKHVSAIADILHSDNEELEISRMLNEYVAEHLQSFGELYIAVNDKLAEDGIISKANFRKYLKIADKKEILMSHEAQNFTLPKSADLERSRHIGRVVEHLESLPLDHAWRVSVEERKSERSMQQNRYLFGVAYDLISAATGYEKDDIHTSLLGKHFGTKLKRVPKSKYNQEGLIEVPVRTTTTDEHGRRSVLGKIQFAEYVAFVQRFSVENLGVVIPDPDPDWALHALSEEAA